MEVLIRADSSLRIGSGHVARCLTLAERLRNDGAKVRFVCRSLPGNVNELVRARGFPVVTFPEEATDVASAEWQHPEPEDDAVETLAAAGARSPVDWLIVDCYALGARWEQRVRPAARRILAIDDLANRQHACDVLLDQNLRDAMHTAYQALLPANCRRLLGPLYALLRPEFAAARQALRQRDGSIRRVLVSFGGTDPDNETAKALSALLDLEKNTRLTVDVVIGPVNRYTAALEALCARLSAATLHRDVSNMAELMARADLGIGASGGTAWERCCVGLPAVIVSLAANQAASAKCLDDHRCAIYVGDCRSVSAQAIRDAIAGLSDRPATVAAMSDACAALVDGKGAERVRRALDGGVIALRPAQRSDCQALYEWRSAEVTRSYSHDPSPITREQHDAWFDATLGNADRALLIGERDGQPIGVLRYDVSSDEAMVSIYLVPGRYGLGYGPRLLCAGYEWVKAHRTGVKSLRAEVLPENRISREAFLQAGYEFDGAAFMKSIV